MSFSSIGKRTPPAARWPTLVLSCLLCIAGCERKGRPAAQTFQSGPALDTEGTGAKPPAAAAGPLVVFLGDSIAAGLGLPENEAFPAVLAAELAKRGTPFRLSNAGVSGDTSAGGLRRLDWVLKQKPSIVVVELGANDGLRGLPLSELEKNLRAILLRIRARGARPLLLGMLLPPSYGPEYTEAFGALYPRLAEELDVPLVASFMAGVAGVADLNQPDGIHPTRKGHRRLATTVAPALTALLSQPE